MIIFIIGNFHDISIITLFIFVGWLMSHDEVTRLALEWIEWLAFQESSSVGIG
jgi:hypothetical protein